MPLFENNLSPYLTIVEATEPAAPSAGQQRLYIDSTTHKLKRTDSSGVDVTIEGGSVATDAIWDAAGDLAVGTGADTAAKLAKGNAGGVLAMGNSAVIWNANTSFPASKATGDRYFRTDLGDEYFWDGTNWVSTTSYYYPLTITGTQGIAATAILQRAGIPPVADLYVYGFYTSYFVSGGTALDGSNKWIGTVSKTGGATSTSMGTITINSGASSQWLVAATLTINALMTVSTYKALEISWAKTGTPGPLYAHVMMVYRNVAT